MSQEILNRSNQDMTQMSFQQTSTLLSLIITIGTALYYFVNAWQMQPDSEAIGMIPESYGSLVLNTAVIITLAQIVLQIVLAFGSGSAPAKTAHEVQASLKSQRNAYFVLAFTLFLGITSFWGDTILFHSVELLIIGFVLSEIVKLASQLFYGRRVAVET